MHPCLSVIIPVYNEANTILAVVNLVLNQPSVQQLVIVDDASCDCTWDKLQEVVLNPRVLLVRHEINQGKGAALRTGITLATAPIVLIHRFEFVRHGNLLQGFQAGSHPTDTARGKPVWIRPRGHSQSVSFKGTYL